MCSEQGSHSSGGCPGLRAHWEGLAVDHAGHGGKYLMENTDVNLHGTTYRVKELGKSLTWEPQFPHSENGCASGSQDICGEKGTVRTLL